MMNEEQSDNAWGHSRLCMVESPSTPQQPEGWVNQWLSGVWFLTASSSILSLSAMSNAVTNKLKKKSYKT